ncbi:AbrB/MazE/SpoVT family DNA-binding domain-containing protein [Leifsonia sp. McL0607]|uniref:AbrB/MazE/SpoVT family DNA-binding domain-containing protein n=1 Tax=Leifsonia sp. McL0607 TaxID=3415672 RepID=UPI003CEBF795
MPQATLRRKNQMTLPAKAVKDLGLREGERLDIEVSGDAIIVKAHVDAEDWATEDVLAEIEEAAKGPFQTFASMEELERELDV